MPLHEGEKYRCVECNSQVSVERSSDTRSLDFEISRSTDFGPADHGQNTANQQLRLYCCGKEMVRFCTKGAS